MPTMTGGVGYQQGQRRAPMSGGSQPIARTPRRRKPRPNFMLAGVTMYMVMAQGALGAITVYFKLPWYVSTAHLLLAMSYFATLLYTVYITRPERPAPPVDLGNTRWWIALAVGALFVQVLLGALVRHSEATLACIGIPTCTIDGEWFPDALTQRVHMIHRAWGCVTAIITILAAVQVYRRARGWPAVRRLMILAPLLVALQVTLGVYVVLTYRSVPIAVAHFAGAMSLWALWFSTWLWTRQPSHVAVLAPVRGIHAVP
jgi:heme A synthase